MMWQWCRSCVPLVAVLALGGALAAGERQERSNAEGELTARAILRDARGATVGDARLVEGPHGVLLELTLDGVPPGTRAWHIHETGRCDAPDFDSAGGHFAPFETQHGFMNPHGVHAGDLPNLEVAAAGRHEVALFVHVVTLGSGPASLLDGDGAALVVHEGKDDYRTDPSGDAGDRLACGVITRTSSPGSRSASVP